ncbi:hypothetical protein UA08_08942 [Talaromyces atroroseus]|uniref:F-box domain-containing protein n=1 Tax=Talaromyces atroroseus TaxID=1441469 RepID=A0A225AFY5_TALAT|nr:hypothetical protein UA08_08942 [Talaromyces atroroseus]OKL55888.1 hypothetical protein UA08_08942 [Talaromyces atroroseus]
MDEPLVLVLALFRHITLLCRDSQNIQTDLTKLEEFSKGRYTTAVFQVDLYMAWSRLLLDLDKGISPILAEFANLKAFQAHIGHSSSQVNDLASMALSIMCRLPLKRLTELYIGFGFNFTHDGDPPASTKASSVQIDPKLGLENLKHLGLRGSVRIEQDGAAELYPLLRTAVNLDSLQLEDCDVAKSLDINSITRLQYLSLRLLDIAHDDLLCMLKKCKASLISIHFGAVSIKSGSMLPVLFQISRDLDLLEFEFTDRRGYQGRPIINAHLKSRYVQDEAVLCYYAYGSLIYSVE